MKNAGKENREKQASIFRVQRKNNLTQMHKKEIKNILWELENTSIRLQNYDSMN